MGESSACEPLSKLSASSLLWGLRRCSCSCILLPGRPSSLEQPERVVVVRGWMGGTRARPGARGPARPAQGLVETRRRSHMDPCGARPAIAAGLV